MPLTLGNLLVIVDITTYVSHLQLNNSSSHHSIYSNFQKRHLPFLLPPKSTITPKVLGLRQRHGAKETQAVVPNEKPESVETPIGKHQRR